MIRAVCHLPFAVRRLKPVMTDLSNLLFSPEYAFARTAFLVSALASVSFGVMGTFVVVRRIGYIAGAISHCAFGGIGIGLFLRQTVASGIDPIFVAVLVSVGCALIIGAYQLYGKEREDTIIGAIWAVGMAVGLLCLDKTEGYHSISSYLFGDILFISLRDIYFVAGLGFLVVVVVALCFQRFAAVCFDEEFSRLRGIRTGFYFQLLLVLTAITVVLMVQIVGIILVIAMLTLPAATAGHLTKRLFPMAVLAVIFCFLCSWGGLYLSIAYNFSAGPMMILVSAVVYVTVKAVGWRWHL